MTAPTMTPCDYCGTPLDEHGCEESGVGQGMITHFTTVCRERVHAAMRATQRELATEKVEHMLTTTARDEWASLARRLRTANDAFQDTAEALREEIDARTKERDEARAERDALQLTAARLFCGCLTKDCRAHGAYGPKDREACDRLREGQERRLAEMRWGGGK